MIKKNYILKFILIIIVFACSCKNQDNDDDSDSIKIDIDKYISDEPIKFSDIFSDYYFIPLKTSQNLKIGTIDDIIIKDGSIFIFDKLQTKKVYSFNMKGQLIGEIGNIGKGPGEHIHPLDFDVISNESKVAIYDGSCRRLNFFNYQGVYLNNIAFEKGFQSFIFTKDLIFFYQTPFSGLSSKEKLLYIYDHKGKEIGSFLKNDGIPQRGLILDKGKQFFQINNDVRFTMLYNDNIFTINKAGVKPYITLNSKLYKVSDNELLQLLNSRRRREINKILNLREYSENDEMCFFKFDIGVKTYSTFHFFESNKTICTHRLLDDLTLTFPKLFKLANNMFIGIIDYQGFSRLKESIIADKLNIKKDEKESMLEALDNPVIVLYKLKDQ